MTRTYSELITIETFNDRFEYLSLSGNVAEETFGYERYLNQGFYRSKEWRDVRTHIIARDIGRDLGVEGYDIFGKILIHHIEPLRSVDFEHPSKRLLNPDNLITTCVDTHNGIHYGGYTMAVNAPVIRVAGDTTLW